MYMHSNCFPARGVKYFKCIKCGEGSFNYANGVDICPECLNKNYLCTICGKSFLDKKPISSESDSILDHEKKYNIWEAVHLMKNHDITMVDSYFKIEWKVKDGYRTLLGARSNTEIEYFFDECFGVFDLLDLTFTLVKPVEEVKEKWIRIDTHKDLCSAIVNKKMIRFDGEIVNPSKEYHDKQIEGLFKAFARGMFKIDYLEEN